MKIAGACPVSKTIGLLSDSWTMHVMHALLLAPKRFCELERALPGISTRTLTLKLKKLEEEGLVLKEDAGIYTPTDKGRGLRSVEKAMFRYGERYLT